MKGENSLRLGMLGWQLSTTVLFTGFYYILRYAFDILKSNDQFWLYWSFYIMLTLYHGVLYMLFKQAIITSQESISENVQ